MDNPNKETRRVLQPPFVFP